MLIVVACALWYAYATNHQMLDTFVFSTPEDIGKSFSKFRETMVKNMFASFLRSCDCTCFWNTDGIK